MVLRIAFGCQSRVGKDSVCEFLADTFGGKVYHFSDELYSILYYAQQVCGFEKEKDVKFLQWIGTEWARSIDENVWVNALMNKLPDNQNCFIADLRFRNELTELRRAGYKCVRIVRDDRPIDRDVTHKSEVDLIDYDGWDAIVHNDSTLENLFEKVLQIVKDFELKK